MNESIILSIPYPVKIFGFQIILKRKIGFLFTNRAKAVLYDIVEADGCKTAQEYEKKYGMQNLINQMLYCSAVAYCMDPIIKRKQNFTQKKLIVGISLLFESDQKKILKAMQNAQAFGILPEKKKAMKLKSR